MSQQQYTYKQIIGTRGQRRSVIFGFAFLLTGHYYMIASCPLYAGTIGWRYREFRYVWLVALDGFRTASRLKHKTGGSETSKTPGGRLKEAWMSHNPTCT